MKLKNIQVGDILEVKDSIVGSEFNDLLKPNDLCEVTYVEPPQYEGELTVHVAFNGDNVEWVNHRHLRKPRPIVNVELTGSDLTRKMLADGETNIDCYVCDDGDESAENDKLIRTVTGFYCGEFKTNGASWMYAVPVKKEKELTGSELCKAMLARGDSIVLCIVKDHECEHRYYDAITNVDKNGCFDSSLSSWQYAIPINNQGEPLTAAEAGL